MNTVLRADDRKDLACLGLMVLVYGLAVAPVVHAVVGHGGVGHGHVHGLGVGAHEHGPASDGHGRLGQNRPGRDVDGHGSDGHGPDGHQHQAGSVEHLHALAATWAPLGLPKVRWLSWPAGAGVAPSRVTVSEPRPTVMPQGP